MFNWGSLFSGIGKGVDAVGGWGNVIKGGVGIYGAMQDKKGAQSAAQTAAQQSTPYGYSTGSMWGNTMVDPRTRQMQFSMAQNPFAQMMNIGGLQGLSNAYSASGSAYGGANPEIVAAANAMYGPQMEQEASGRLSALRQLAQPEEARATQGLESRLFSMGRLGGTGGAVEQEALARAQSAADLQRQLTSQDWASNRAQNRFQTALQAVGAGQQGQAQQFGMGMQSQGGLQAMFQQLLQQGQLGVQAGAATPGNVAALGYNANTMPGAGGALGAWANESGIFNKIGDWLGSKTGGTPIAPGPTGYTGINPGNYGITAPSTNVFANIGNMPNYGMQP